MWIVKVNFAPFVASEETPIFPSCNCTIFLEMASPNPLPFDLRMGWFFA